jgi:hypothetical protein
VTSRMQSLQLAHPSVSAAVEHHLMMLCMRALWQPARDCSCRICRQCLIIAAAHAGIDGSQQAPTGGCLCPDDYAPVCAIDGAEEQTFANACYASCNNAVIARTGSCLNSGGFSASQLDQVPLQSSTPPTAAPTPASPPATSSASSQAQKQQDCFCAEIYDPVCGDDRKVYPNSCHAKCAGVKVISKGDDCGGFSAAQEPGDINSSPAVVTAVSSGNVSSCNSPANCNTTAQTQPKPSCACAAAGSEPVCGKDGITYPCKNAADCLGIPIALLGSCEPKQTPVVIIRLPAPAVASASSADSSANITISASQQGSNSTGDDGLDNSDSTISGLSTLPAEDRPKLASGGAGSTSGSASTIPSKTLVNCK